MKRVVLAGNPNVGKSLLFSRLTRIGIATANYAGTTVDMKAGKCRFGGQEYELIDGPGIYSLEEFSKTDEIAMQLIEQADVIIDVVDATNLERNLNLTLQLLGRKIPMVVCLNFWEDTAHRGISIDAKALEVQLGVPVVTVSALECTGLSDLLTSIESAKPGEVDLDEIDRWNAVGLIVKSVQKLTHRHHTVLERISDLTLHPVGGIVTAVAVLVVTLVIVRFMGEGLINYVFEPFYTRIYDPFIRRAVGAIPVPVIRELLIGTTKDPLQSFGILTSGIYIALVSVFPYFFSFYLVFGFLEDFGYLPRLAAVLDNFFHGLGLHGYSSIPVMLGLGCKVPAFMSTRSLTNRREKILTIMLIFMSTPCLSQSAMIVSIGMNYGVLPVISVYIVLIALALGMNWIMNKVYKKEAPSEFFTEFPAIRMPSVKLMANKLGIRIAEYFSEVLPMIAIGVLAMNVLSAVGVMAAITKAIEWPAKYMLGLPPEIAPIMLLNFLRKDASVALLVPLGLSAKQFVIACVFLTLSMPCVASFFTMIKELGVKTALKLTLLVLVVATVASTALHLLTITV